MYTKPLTMVITIVHELDSWTMYEVVYLKNNCRFRDSAVRELPICEPPWRRGCLPWHHGFAQWSQHPRDHFGSLLASTLAICFLILRKFLPSGNRTHSVRWFSHVPRFFYQNLHCFFHIFWKMLTSSHIVPHFPSKTSIVSLSFPYLPVSPRSKWPCPTEAPLLWAGHSRAHPERRPRNAPGP